MELVDEALDEPVAVDGIVHDLLHGSADGEEVLVLFILQSPQDLQTFTAPETGRNPSLLPNYVTAKQVSKTCAAWAG